MAPAMRTVHLTITGRVQGVGYRDWTRREAVRLGLCGWVRNRPDGSVEALLQGGPDSLTRMLEACHHGPPAARVTGVGIDEVEAPALAGFDIRPTG